MSDNALMLPPAAPRGPLAPARSYLPPQAPLGAPPSPGGNPLVAAPSANPLIVPAAAANPLVQAPGAALPAAAAMPEGSGQPRSREGMENRVSTRIPTSKRLTLDPHERNDITIGAHAMIPEGFSTHHFGEEHHQLGRAAVADALEKTAGHIREAYPFIDTSDLTHGGVLAGATQHMHDNIVWLWNQVKDQPWRDEAANWYWGANKMAKDLAQQYGVSGRQGAAVIASLSPQKDWDQNVSLAQRVLDTHRNQQQTQVTPEMRDVMQGYVDARSEKTRHALDIAVNGGTSKTDDTEFQPISVGTKLADLRHPVQQALFARAYDEAHRGDRGYDIISPSGQRQRAKTGTGVDATAAWGGFSEIANAFRALQADHLPTISRALGGQHKVRNFYNNITAPDAAAFLPFSHHDVTADTHAINVGLMMPMGGGHPMVSEGLGAGGPAWTGAQGLYGLHADAYRRAAQTISQQEGRRFLPREVQSVTWEAVRSMFQKAHKKTDPVSGMPLHTVGQTALGAAYAARHGFMSPDMARGAVLQAAVGQGGIPAPRWHTGGPVVEEEAA